MRKFITISSLSLTLTLGACGYVTEGSNQDITFLTPGAQDAKCYAYVDGLKYQIYPPQTINIKKSPKDLEVICEAPGNRVVESIVPAEVLSQAVWGGPAGVAWDYASQSLHYYPSVVSVDFTNVPTTLNDLPQHNNKDLPSPDSYMLEEFRPSTPRLNEDANRRSAPLLRRGESNDWGDNNDNDSNISKETPPESSKGSLIDVIESLSSGQIDIDTAADNAGTSSDPVNIAPQSGSNNKEPSQSVTPMPSPGNASQASSVEPESGSPKPNSGSIAMSDPVQLYPGQ